MNFSSLFMIVLLAIAPCMRFLKYPDSWSVLLNVMNQSPPTFNLMTRFMLGLFDSKDSVKKDGKVR
jgi:hypothetical protein